MIQGNENYVDVKTLAEHFKLAPSFIYKLKDKKKIPYYKIEGTYRFKLSEVEGVVETEMKYA